MNSAVLEEIIGLSPTEASKLLKSNGYLFKIAIKDNIRFDVKDNRKNIIKVKVEKNEVTEILA